MCVLLYGQEISETHTHFLTTIQHNYTFKSNLKVPVPLSQKLSDKVGNASSASSSNQGVTPGQKEKRTRAKKRSKHLLSPAMPSKKRTKTASEHTHLKTKDLEKPQAGHSSISQDPENTYVSADELLGFLAEFLCRRCRHIKKLSPDDIELWLFLVDLDLLEKGYQHEFFTCPGSLVSLYMLCRDVVSAEVASISELQAVVHACLYLTYSYIGPEIGYPARPFIVENRGTFWKRCLEITNCMSEKMLRLNNDPQYYYQVFSDFRNQTDR